MCQNIEYKKISVCLATYNGENYILQQLLSIIPQLSTNDEIIISDDGSTDKTKDIILSLDDKRIKIVNNFYERGYTNNFQNALENVTGDLIFLSDQDDIWFENKVKVCLSYLRNYNFIVSNAIVIDAHEKIINNSFFSIKKPFKSFIGNIYRFSYLGCCMCFTKEILDFALPFPKNKKLCTHDNWLFLIGKLFFKMKITNQPLIFYRRHGSNTSFGAEINYKRNPLIFMLKYRLYLLYNIIRLLPIKYILKISRVSG